MQRDHWTFILKQLPRRTSAYSLIPGWQSWPETRAAEWYPLVSAFQSFSSYTVVITETHVHSFKPQPSSVTPKFNPGWELGPKFTVLVYTGILAALLLILENWMKVLQSVRAKTTLGIAVIYVRCLAYLVLSWSANEWPESSLASWWPSSESVPVSRAGRPGINERQLSVQTQQLLEIISGIRRSIRE